MQKCIGPRSAVVKRGPFLSLASIHATALRPIHHAYTGFPEFHATFRTFLAGLALANSVRTQRRYLKDSKIL